MKDFEVVGYTLNGAFYCPECFDGDPNDDEVGVVFASSEWDSYPVCNSCSETCEDVSLTTEGEKWLKEQQEM